MLQKVKIFFLQDLLHSVAQKYSTLQNTFHKDNTSTGIDSLPWNEILTAGMYQIEQTLKFMVKHRVHSVNDMNKNSSEQFHFTLYTEQWCKEHLLLTLNFSYVHLFKLLWICIHEKMLDLKL